MPHTRNFRWLLPLVALTVLVVDQWSKARIIDWLPIGESWRPWRGTPLLELFAFTHTKNTGAAFGIFQTGGWFFIIVAIVVSCFILWYAPRLPQGQWWLFLSLGLELGGAIGNLVDRLRIGWVTDFIHIGSFAIFNVADSAIVCGVVILAIHMWQEDKQKQPAPDQAIPPAEQPPAVGSPHVATPAPGGAADPIGPPHVATIFPNGQAERGGALRDALPHDMSPRSEHPAAQEGGQP